MVTVTLRCQHCESRKLVRNGLAADGRQRYLCRDCGQRSRQDPRRNAYSEEEREQILRAYDERSSLRGLSRTFAVSRQLALRTREPVHNRRPRARRPFEVIEHRRGRPPAVNGKHPPAALAARGEYPLEDLHLIAPIALLLRPPSKPISPT